MIEWLITDWVVGKEFWTSVGKKEWKFFNLILRKPQPNIKVNYVPTSELWLFFQIFFLQKSRATLKAVYVKPTKIKACAKIIMSHVISLISKRSTWNVKTNEIHNIKFSTRFLQCLTRLTYFAADSNKEAFCSFLQGLLSSASRKSTSNIPLIRMLSIESMTKWNGENLIWVGGIKTLKVYFIFSFQFRSW